MKIDISKIFVFKHQVRLTEKVTGRHHSIRVIAIPEIPKFFQEPVTLDKAIDYYLKYLKRYKPMSEPLSESNEIPAIFVTICDHCKKELKEPIDLGIVDIIEQGWFVVMFSKLSADRKIEYYSTHYCSEKCLQEHLEEHWKSSGTITTLPIGPLK